MTKQTLIYNLLDLHSTIKDNKTKIKEIDISMSETYQRLQVKKREYNEIESEYNRLTKAKNDILNKIKWDVEEANVQVGEFGKDVPCGIAYGDELIVVSKTDITIEKNFIL